MRPFQAFLDDTRDDVWAFLVAAVGRGDADDCFQETYTAAFTAYDRLRPGSNLRAWVLTIASRKAIDHHRASARRPSPVDYLPEVARHEDEAEVTDLWAKIRTLPEKQRAAVTLRFAGDLTHREIAEALGCSVEAARRSTHEAIAKLRLEVTR